MPDSYLPCDSCGGSRYGRNFPTSREGQNHRQVLQLSFDEAAVFFDFHSQLSQVCQLMVDCGLVPDARSEQSPSLSGGEAQRLKLVTELAGGLRPTRNAPAISRCATSTCSRSRRSVSTSATAKNSSACCTTSSTRGTRWSVIEHHLDLARRGGLRGGTRAGRRAQRW